MAGTGTGGYCHTLRFILAAYSLEYYATLRFLLSPAAAASSVVAPFDPLYDGPSAASGLTFFPTPLPSTTDDDNDESNSIRGQIRYARGSVRVPPVRHRPIFHCGVDFISRAGPFLAPEEAEEVNKSSFIISAIMIYDRRIPGIVNHNFTHTHTIIIFATVPFDLALFIFFKILLSFTIKL